MKNIHFDSVGQPLCNIYRLSPIIPDADNYLTQHEHEVNCEPCKRALFMDFLIDEGYYNIKRLKDGRWCGLFRFLFTEAIVVGLTRSGYEYRYCYEPDTIAAEQLKKYNGTEEPTGWITKK